MLEKIMLGRRSMGAGARRPRGDDRGRWRSGFSFIEVMLVVVIIGLLAGVVTLSTRYYLDKARQTRARADLATYRSALESYYADRGDYPTGEQGLAVLVPQYIDKLRADPWGRPYEYRRPGRTGPYEVVCLGSDGREGGEGAAADLSTADTDKIEKTENSK